MRLHRDAKTALIRSLPLFADCTGEEVAAIAAVADEIDLPAGKELTVERAHGAEFVIIVEGSAAVSRGDSVLATLGAGDHFGEVALLTGKPRNATVMSTSPVHALVVSGHSFVQLLDVAPGLRSKVEAAGALREAS